VSGLCPTGVLGQLVFLGCEASEGGLDAFFLHNFAVTKGYCNELRNF
jgi:hypothetical protein